MSAGVRVDPGTVVEARGGRHVSLDRAQVEAVDPQRHARRRARPAAPAGRRALARGVGRHRSGGQPGRSGRLRHGRLGDRRRPRGRGARGPRHPADLGGARLRARVVDLARVVSCSAASYSGDTEETLACFEAAGAAGARRVALTTGGALAEAARAEDVPVIGVPAGMQPRAAVLYGTVGALECAARLRRRAGAPRRDRHGRRAARAAGRGVGPGRARTTLCPSGSPASSRDGCRSSTAPARPPRSRAAGRPS